MTKNTGGNAPPSRRAVLCSALGATLVTSPALPLPLASRPWDRALSAYLAADAAVGVFEREVRAPALRHVEGQAGKRPPFTFTVEHSPGHRDTYDLPLRWIERGAPLSAVGHDEAVPLIAAHRAWWKRYGAAEQQVDMLAIDMRDDQLLAALTAARTALLREPAPDARALAFKLRLVLANIADCAADREVDGLVADADRLAEAA